MDVRGVLRKLRLPLVASLFVALLGAPAVAAPVTAALPVPAVATAAPAPVAVSASSKDLAAAGLARVSIAPHPVAPAIVVLLGPGSVRRLTGLAGEAKADPRAPPTLA